VIPKNLVSVLSFRFEEEEPLCPWFEEEGLEGLDPPPLVDPPNFMPWPKIAVRPKE